MPAAGKDKLQHYMQKFGPSAKGFLTDPNNQLNQRGKPIGCDFQYHEGSKVFNSLNAHKLLTWAGLQGVEAQNKLCEVYFRQYFKEGKCLGLVDQVIPGAVEAGLDEAEARKVLADDAHPIAAKTEEELVESHSKVRGVPHFYFPDGEQLSGGQPVEVFEQTLRTALARAAKAAQ